MRNVCMRDMRGATCIMREQLHACYMCVMGECVWHMCEPVWVVRVFVCMRGNSQHWKKVAVFV